MQRLMQLTTMLVAGLVALQPARLFLLEEEIVRTQWLAGSFLCLFRWLSCLAGSLIIRATHGDTAEGDVN